MFSRQKEAVLALLKSNETHRDYAKKCWLSYKDFLDPADGFTDFACENLDGKREYLNLIEDLLYKDETAKIFVEVYGAEENDNEQVIYADTLIVFSRLSLVEIKHIFSQSKDKFPSCVGEVTNHSHRIFLVVSTGDLIPVLYHSNGGYSIYYCWWD